MTVHCREEDLSLLGPEREQDTIADEDPQGPQDGQPGTNVAEVTLVSGQKVPALQLLR